MKTAFIIHGSFGNPDENWFPWLKKELENIGYQVFVPKFPTPENQSLDIWKNVFKEYKKHINSETIFIGHSLGPAFILDILENTDKSTRASFLVAGFLGLLGNREFDSVNKSFTDRDFNWNNIQKNCRKFYIYQSTNDPYIPKEKALELAEKLNTEIIEIPDAGHFNSDAGYTKFGKLLNDIKNLSTK